MSLFRLFPLVCLLIVVSVRNTSSKCLNNFIFGGTNTFYDLAFPLKKTEESYRSEDSSSSWSAHEDMETEHTSTFIQFSSSLLNIPVERLIVQLAIVDISAKVNGDPKYELSMEDVNSTLNSDMLQHLKDWPSLLVFKFGWSKYFYKDHEKYVGSGKENTRPALSSEVIEWLTTHEALRTVVGIGVDLPSIGSGTNQRTLWEKLTNAGLYIVKDINLDQDFIFLSGHDCSVTVLPQKVNKRNAPVNIAAICPKEEQQCGEDSKKQDNHEHKEKCHKCHKEAHEEVKEFSGNEEHKSEHKSGHKSKCMKHKQEHKTDEHKDKTDEHTDTTDEKEQEQKHPETNAHQKPEPLQKKPNKEKPDKENGSQGYEQQGFKEQIKAFENKFKDKFKI